MEGDAPDSGDGEQREEREHAATVERLLVVGLFPVEVDRAILDPLFVEALLRHVSTFLVDVVFEVVVPLVVVVAHRPSSAASPPNARA
jgi:hypothetical protein